MKFINELVPDGRPLVLVDVDGVMQDNHHRLHWITELKTDGAGTTRLVNKKGADWSAYIAEERGDGPGHFAHMIRPLVKGGMRVVYLTARADQDGECTDREECISRTWLQDRLAKISDEHCPLIMRAPYKGKSYPPAADFKRQAVEALRASGHVIFLAVDDSHRNCVVFAEMGIPTVRFYNHLIPELHWY